MLNTLDAPIPARGAASESPTTGTRAALAPVTELPANSAALAPAHDLTQDEARVVLARRIRSFYPK